jgi:phospholipid/cholesterol/gamma-HCH transport system substrate-binding protein
MLAALAVLAITIFFIGKQKNMFSSTFPAHADFRNVSGLQVGNYVRFNGINVGTVDGITIENDTMVRVDFILQSNVKPFIKSDSKASIGSDGLMGDKLVQIAPGNDSAGPPKNGQLVAVNPLDIDKIMAKLAGVANGAEDITTNLAQIIAKVNNGQGSLGELINSNKMANTLESTMANSKQTVSTVNQAAGNLNEDLQAAQHNFLLRGYFKKKEKQRIADSIKNANKAAHGN